MTYQIVFLGAVVWWCVSINKPLFVANALPQDLVEDAVDSSASKLWLQSDHLERDISAIGLEESKLQKVQQIFSHPLLQDAMLLKKATDTGMSISPHLVFRYLESVEWSDKYHGKPVIEAIVETIEWRHSFGINKIDTTSIVPLVQKGLGYTSEAMDKHGRVIIYLKIGRNDKMETAEVYLKHMMYITERADRQSINGGSGQFVAIVDLHGLTWGTCPPMGMLKEAISVLKKHYPYRLGGIFIVNAPGLFNWIWKLLKPFMPARALAKTFVLDHKDKKTTPAQIMEEKLGLGNVEEGYGGVHTEVSSIGDVDAFMSKGYWEQVHRRREDQCQADGTGTGTNAEGSCSSVAMQP